MVQDASLDQPARSPAKGRPQYAERPSGLTITFGIKNDLSPGAM
jgi:hypothetical protein